MRDVKRTPAEQRQFLEEKFRRTEEHKRKQLAAQQECVTLLSCSPLLVSI